jgi:transcriptional regulator with XRE-family HTH domain
MQAFLSIHPYDLAMATKSRLRQLREAKGISVRELARQIDEHHTNVSYWERSGQVPRSNTLIPLAKALGVTVEVLLGEPHAKRVISPGGKMRQLFDVASTLPRQKQKAVVEILEGYLKTATTGHAKAA